MHLTLVTPHLFWPDPALPEIYRDLPLPALSWLLSRGAHAPQPLSLHHWLAQRFGMSTDGMLPWAPLSLLLDGTEPAGDYWMRADPVHLQVNRDQLILADSGILSITQYEADAIMASLNQHFSEDGLHFIAPYPNRWYLRCNQTPHITVVPVEHVIGQDIHRHLPQGHDAMHWHHLLNELQMLLYNHPVNDARDAAGDPTINSIWPWGGGTLPPSLHKPYQQCWADQHEAAALAHAAQLPFDNLPATATVWHGQAQGEQQLIILDSLSGAASYGDAYGWRETLLHLEQDWFTPMKTLLASGQLNSLLLVAPGYFDCLIKPTARWQFWKGSQSLGHWASAGDPT
ncbi:phosphoglycerate mutase [Chitinivorax sp. B]|uniref:phosphoglycerate mutase n=1 Tax=Chitinivorax sp. B TaxID=2502235 RepID=UPI001484E1B0|nr:phosphoglycerate mutase [Chitinivorax sp. B]